MAVLIVNIVKPVYDIICVFPLVNVCLRLDVVNNFFHNCLLILPSSGLQGFISLQLGLLLKFGLWSLRVKNASLFAVMFILSLSFSHSGILSVCFI